MPSNNSYVDNAGLLSYGLSNLGTKKQDIDISGQEGVEELGGKLIGLGFIEGRSRCAKLLQGYTSHQDPFIRKCAYFGLSLIGLLDRNPQSVNEFLQRGVSDSVPEVRKTAIIGFGIANTNRKEKGLGKLLEDSLHSEDWKIRSAVGLSYSFFAYGNPRYFSKFVELLETDTSPYVKVCSCWYISNAFAGSGEGLTEYLGLLERKGDENSFFRDMACMGLGLSFLATSNDQIFKILEEIIEKDSHPYVRESAMFGLALCYFRSPQERVLRVLKKGLQDPSSITRSGAALGLGIISMGQRELKVTINGYTDPSVLWGLILGEGLSQSKQSEREFQNSYVQWGRNIGLGFRESIPLPVNADFISGFSFVEQINKGLIGSGISNGQERDAIRLMLPGIFHYLIYDSFWWGLWVMNSLGIGLRGDC